MKIATMTTLCYSARGRTEKTSALEAVRRLRAVGFEYVDLNLCGMVQGHQCSFVQDDWKSEVKELVREVKRLGATLHQANYKGCLNYEIGVNKTVPDLLRDEMAKYCFKAGEYLVKMFEGTAE